MPNQRNPQKVMKERNPKLKLKIEEGKKGDLHQDTKNIIKEDQDLEDKAIGDVLLLIVLA
jgi:hypothetical protein